MYARYSKHTRIQPFSHPISSAGISSIFYSFPLNMRACCPLACSLPLAQAAKKCFCLFFSPLPIVLCVSASLRENAFSLSHYPLLITHHCFTSLREALCPAFAFREGVAYVQIVPCAVSLRVMPSSVSRSRMLSERANSFFSRSSARRSMRRRISSSCIPFSARSFSWKRPRG